MSPKRQFRKSYLSGGLCKIPIRTGLDLGRKISIKILFVLIQKSGFQLYEIEFLTKQATPPPLRDRSDLTRSYPSISSSLLKTALSSLVSFIYFKYTRVFFYLMLLIDVLLQLNK